MGIALCITFLIAFVIAAILFLFYALTLSPLCGMILLFVYIFLVLTLGIYLHP